MQVLVTGATGKVGQALIARPAYDLARLIDSAWDYIRPPSDARKVWYPG